ncbi:hypothetical protein BAE44_0002138 [Dichanthelium oligosanthes]|uniref:PWWP domain-containing protein n=1 Tax=Dichanthelium oligosanthes TaxID=888268 RepID=A0A1E5WHH4_9POAL|nr:hypothetical protein BAE44_0002138 [Dichanthelium oligosanthes]
MADARGEAPNNASGGTSTRPARLRVIRQDVQEVLKRPRRSRPNKQHLPPQPPPPRKKREKEKEKERENKAKEKKDRGEKEEKGKEEKEKEEEEQVEPARYNCAFQHEDEGSRDFAPPELVWGKVRSHPWWPGQVFDAADASEVALQHRKAGAPLVAYFWDRTFAWSDGSALLPFRANFTRLSAQSTMSGFVFAVDAALQEVGRRVEAGLSCSCFGSSIATKQDVQNSGIRQGAYGASVDASYMRDAFDGEAFLDYISALGNRPLAGADLLDLATAKAQLRAFNQSRGPRDLPEFVLFEGIEEFAEEIPHTKGQRMHKSGKDDVLSKEKKSGRAGSSLHRKEALPEAMDEDRSGGATDDASSNKGKNSKRMKSSVKKVDISKHSGGLHTVGVVDSTTPANKTVDDILGVSKSGRTLRSMRKKEDALEGLKMLGKDDSDETLIGKSKDAPLLKESKLMRRPRTAGKKSKITEDWHELGDRIADDSTSPGKRRSGRDENKMNNRVPISEHGRKKKKLSELMAETGRPNSASDGKSKTRGKHSSHESTEKAEDPDLDSKDMVKTRKRKKLNTLGDLSSQSEPLRRKKSTKVGELMTKASGSSISHTPPAVEANGAESQTKSRRAKHRQVNAAVMSPHPVKVNRGKKEAFSEESLSCDEMLWQLSVAACDLKQREKIAPTSVNFFTDFRKNSSVSSSDVNEEIPEKAANTEPTPSEPPIADHMQDDYWADILINVEEPLSSLKKKKDESKKRTSKKAHQVKKLTDNPSVTLENADEPRSGGKGDTEVEQLKAESKPVVANGSQLNTGTKSAEEMEHSVLAGLVLHFSGPRAVPSRSDLIKIFSQYGPVSEAKAEIANNANSAQVIFKRRMDAEAAFAGAGKISALGPALVSFRLTDFPAVALANEPSHGASKRG